MTSFYESSCFVKRQLSELFPPEDKTPQIQRRQQNPQIWQKLKRDRQTVKRLGTAPGSGYGEIGSDEGNILSEKSMGLKEAEKNPLLSGVAFFPLQDGSSCLCLMPKKFPVISSSRNSWNARRSARDLQKSRMTKVPHFGGTWSKRKEESEKSWVVLRLTRGFTSSNELAIDKIHKVLVMFL